MKLKLKEYLKKNMTVEDLELYRKMQVYQLLKYISLKEKMDFKELREKYLK